MGDNNSQTIHDFIKLFMGIILGSGIAGAAVKMVQETPEARLWGVGILLGCVVVVALMFWLGEAAIARKDRLRLTKLSDAYFRALNTTGTRLVDRIERKQAEGLIEPDKMRSFVLETLAELLRKQSEEHQGEEEKFEWVLVFRTSLQRTVKEWTLLAAADQKIGVFPPDGTPENL